MLVVVVVACVSITTLLVEVSKPSSGGEHKKQLGITILFRCASPGVGVGVGSIVGVLLYLLYCAFFLKRKLQKMCFFFLVPVVDCSCWVVLVLCG